MVFLSEKYGRKIWCGVCLGFGKISEKKWHFSTFFLVFAEESDLGWRWNACWLIWASRRMGLICWRPGLWISGAWASAWARHLDRGPLDQRAGRIRRSSRQAGRRLAGGSDRRWTDRLELQAGLLERGLACSGPRLQDWVKNWALQLEYHFFFHFSDLPHSFLPF